ncbi:uncharacterized protein LTR77_009031 [Saxophila tyrrhenica]|uniref:Uncharacterized protein n=1 Tax=Saxophila tyrrhenica TaxID=1690608 RepID=A0AAV9P3A3_9PEZI|nr:hypothetical protein LTR77_009031 [Saxophila tyrrhenica]
MPHAIADSDDDSESEIFVNGGAEGNGQASAVGMEVLGRTNETQSTGSTERLRRQMMSAEQGLMATNNSAPARPRASASSPLDHAKKRRHSELAGPDHGLGAETSVKRVKRVQTYGSRRQRTVLDEEDEDVAVKTSQSARFSEHSGVHSSAELPTGSGPIAGDFANHEPAVMFTDSGSTVEASVSEQQRLLNEALQPRLPQQMTTYPAPASGAEANKPSSSLAWLESQQTPATNGKAGGGGLSEASAESRDNVEGVAYGGGDGLGASADQQQSSGSGDSGEQHTDTSTNTDPEKADKESTQSQDEPDATPLPQAPSLTARRSPMVEIMTTATATAVSPAISPTESTSALKSTKGRRRKSQATDPDSEPLNSDDKAIGLPKERYVPRPSRRRATAALEEPIDYSVAPEKVAKKKRTKSTEETANKSHEDTSELMANILKNLGNQQFQPPPQQNVDGLPPTPKALEARKDDPPPDAPKPDEQAGSPQAVADEKQGSEEPSSSIAVKSKEEHIFVKPAMPTPKPKQSAKARRSHTTIFEDHVEFIGSQRSSPSLSQQQAKRKSALKNPKDEAADTSSRKRRKVVQDDEDDEDELAIVEEDEEEQPPPKKRARGRPPKAAAKPKAKSAEVVHDNSDGEAQPESEVDEAPKKATRGRPSKSTAKSQAKSAEIVRDDSDDDVRPVAEVTEAPNKATRGRPKKVNGAESEKENEPVKPPQGPETEPERDVNKTTEDASISTPQKPQQELPTPSPDKPAEKPTEKAKKSPAAATSQKPTKASPTSHSPIKNSSAVPHRVGLSKRSRIPPLLRVMNPPKR